MRGQRVEKMGTTSELVKPNKLIDAKNIMKAEQKEIFTFCNATILYNI